MREVEFRGKDIKTKEWHYGSLVSKYDADACDYCEYHILEKFEYSRTVDYDSNLYNVDFYEVDENTLGQCTGLKDKNGTKIFEGDIVKDEFGRIMKVIFKENWCKFQFELIKTTGKEWTNNFLFADLTDWFYAFRSDNQLGLLPEIIGNIYDNPELLGGYL